jgi:hypothetical protein
LFPRYGNRLNLSAASWSGLAPGTSQEVLIMVSVPVGHRQQQQQQQEEENELDQVLPPVDHDMPGEWQGLGTVTGKMSRGGSADTIVVSRGLCQKLELLNADHFLVRAHHTQVGGACMGSCMLLRLTQG